MPLTAHERKDVDDIVGFLQQIDRLCPSDELKAMIRQIRSALAADRLQADDDAVAADARAADDPDPESWDATTNNRGTFIRRRHFFSADFDLVGHCDTHAYPFVMLLSLIVHEMYHQLGSEHPETYRRTADLLDAIVACLKRHEPPCAKFLSELESRAADERASFNLPTASNQGRRVKTAVGVGVGAVGGVVLVKVFAGAGTLLAGPLGTIVGAGVGALVGWGISKLF